MAGVEPTFKEFDGHDALRFVVSANERRRHLSDTQRALIADKLATLRNGQNKATSIGVADISQPEAAEMMDVSLKSLQRVRSVREHAEPEVVAMLERGDVCMACRRAAAQPAAGDP